MQGAGEAAAVRIGDEVEGAGCGGGAEPEMLDLHARALVAILGEDRSLRVPVSWVKPYIIPRSHPSYTFGIGVNSRLRALSDDLMKQALEDYRKTKQTQRLFMLVDYQARSWSQSQPVVIKVEANPEGTNRRAVVTNRPGCQVLPSAIYDEYVMRGESENRNKELKIELHAGRLSDHRFLANFFRLYLHTAALNLLVRLRHAVVAIAPTSAELGQPSELPTDALDEPARRKFFNKRRERDPLGGGFACTWRTRLIKVAAEVITRSRRVIVRLSGSWPHIDHFLKVSQAVSRLRIASSLPRAATTS